MDNSKTEYESNGYSYQINEYNQITQAKGELRLEDGIRNLYAQRTAGGEYRHDNDDGGHLIGTRFGGSGELDNLVAEDRYINRGAFKSLENEWANNLESGNRVNVEVEPVYHGQSERPDIITAKTEVTNTNGEREIDYFSVTNENLETEEFDLPSEADEMMGLWSERESEDMAKTLTLSNDEFRQPSNEELFASGEEAIDRHMEILRDEMRSDGMEDGSEMEEVINSRREESLSELRSGIYGSDYTETNSFEEASNMSGEDSENIDSSFSETATYEDDYNNDLLNDNQIENMQNSDEIDGNLPFEQEDIKEDMNDDIDEFELDEETNALEGNEDFEFSDESMDNAFSEAGELDDIYAESDMDSSITDSMDLSGSMDISLDQSR